MEPKTQPPGFGGPERRREARAKVSVPAELHLAGKIYLGVIRDLSTLGAYVELISGDEFANVGNGRLVVKALGPIDVAVRSKRFDEAVVVGLGVQFMGLSGEKRDVLARLIESARVED